MSGQEPTDLDDDDLALVNKLRALPPEGVEPNWQKLEAAIRAEVGDEAPRPWWRNWRWIVPVWALATTAVVALLVTREAPVVEKSPPSQPALTKEVETPKQQPAEAPAAEAMYLDGESVDLNNVDDSFDPLDESAHAELDVEEPDDSFDLRWIDELDEKSMESVEQWLMHKRS